MIGYRFLSIAVVGAVLIASPALAQDATASKFYDTNLLTDTVMADESAALQAALDAKAALPANATPQQIADADQAIADAQASYDSEKTIVDSQIALLSPEQVFALNRSLNNALHNPFGVDIDSEDLQMVIDGNYDKHQINFLTKALESEAKFLYLAQKTGNDRFLEKAEREKQKFLGKIDSFSAKPNVTNATAEAVKDVSKGAAKNAAKQAAKDAAKQAAKDAAKQAAKDAAKQAAKDAAKGRS